jgi:hypothetical protein
MARYKPLHERSDKDVIDTVRQDFAASEDDRSEKNDRNWQAYRLFHCRDLLTHQDVIRSTEALAGGRQPRWDLEAITPNATFLPWLRGIVLTSVARISHGLWPDFNDFYRIDGNDEMDDRSARSAYAITQYFMRASRYKQESMLALLQAHLYDFGILYTGWKSEYSYMPEPVNYGITMLDPSTGEQLPTGKIDKGASKMDWRKIETSGWDVSAINTLNFRYDPLASHDSFGEFCGVTARIPKRRCWEMVESGQWDEAAVAMIDPDEPPNDAGRDDNARDFDDKLKEDEHLKGSNFDMDQYISKRYVRAEFCWTPDSKVVILNGKSVPLKKQSWRIPFHPVKFIQNPGMFPGTSMVEPLIPVQLDMNQCLRLLRKQQDRAVNPDSVVDPTFFGSVEEAEMQPWGTGATMIASQNPQGRDPQLARRFIYHPSNTAPDLWNSIEIQRSTGEKAAGTSAADQGMTTAGATATDINRAAQGGDVRNAMIEMSVEDGLVIKPIEDLIRLISMNVTDEMRIRVAGEVGEEWQTVKPEDLLFKALPDVKALGMSSMASRGAAMQSVRDLTLALLQNPATQQIMLVSSAAQELYRMMDINPRKFITPDAPERNVSIPPQYIPVLLASGRWVQVNQWDDHEAVIRALFEYVQSPEFATVPEKNKKLFLEQIKLHKQMMEAPPGGGMGAPSPTGEGGGVAGVGQPGMPVPGQPTQAPPVAAASGRPAQMPIMPPQQPQMAAGGG